MENKYIDKITNFTNLKISENDSFYDFKEKFNTTVNTFQLYNKVEEMLSPNNIKIENFDTDDRIIIEEPNDLIINPNNVYAKFTTLVTPNSPYKVKKIIATKTKVFNNSNTTCILFFKENITPLYPIPDEIPSYQSLNLLIKANGVTTNVIPITTSTTPKPNNVMFDSDSPIPPEFFTDINSITIDFIQTTSKALYVYIKSFSHSNTNNTLFIKIEITDVTDISNVSNVLFSHEIKTNRITSSYFDEKANKYSTLHINANDFIYFHTPFNNNITPKKINIDGLNHTYLGYSAHNFNHAIIGTSLYLFSLSNKYLQLNIFNSIYNSLSNNDMVELIPSDKIITNFLIKGNIITKIIGNIDNNIFIEVLNPALREVTLIIFNTITFQYNIIHVLSEFLQNDTQKYYFQFNEINDRGHELNTSYIVKNTINNEITYISNKVKFNQNIDKKNKYFTFIYNITRKNQLFIYGNDKISLIEKDIYNDIEILSNGRLNIKYVNFFNIKITSNFNVESYNAGCVLLTDSIEIDDILIKSTDEISNQNTYNNNKTKYLKLFYFRKNKIQKTKFSGEKEYFTLSLINNENYKIK